MKPPRPSHDRVVVPSEDGGLEVRQVPAAEGNPRTAWERVLDDDNDLPWAAPVLLDEDGRDMLPTGEVTVRFDAPPSDDALADLAQRHGVRVRGRNEFVPSQVVVVPEDRRGAYLPEVCEQLEAEPLVAAAWPSTRSRYKRS